jgi:hypothetical protein
VSRRLAVLFVAVAALAWMASLSACAEGAKEDPAEEQQQIQQQVQQPELTDQPEQTEETIGENIQG